MKHLFIVIWTIAAILLVTGCGHNTSLMTVGKGINIGSQTGVGLKTTNGLNILDVSRENSSIRMRINSAAGLSYDPETGTVRGIEEIERIIGVQVTGRLVELAKASPKAAETYLNNSFKIAEANQSTFNPEVPILDLPIPVAHNKVALADWYKVAKKTKAFDDEVVPEGLDIDLEEWIWLKAAYLECPECLLLSEEEEAIIKEALGIE